MFPKLVFALINNYKNVDFGLTNKMYFVYFTCSGWAPILSSPGWAEQFKVGHASLYTSVISKFGAERRSRKRLPIPHKPLQGYLRHAVEAHPISYVTPEATNHCPWY